MGRGTNLGLGELWTVCTHAAKQAVTHTGELLYIVARRAIYFPGINKPLLRGKCIRGSELLLSSKPEGKAVFESKAEASWSNGRPTVFGIFVCMPKGRP